MKDVVVKSLTCDVEAGNRMPETVEEQRVRLIVWQRKGITALFAPMFWQLKENLKRCLKPNVIYTDGLSPSQLAARLNKYKLEDGSRYFVEDDLARQDRQTDNPVLNTEMNVYKELGGNDGWVDVWRTVHRHWRAKGIGIVFYGDASRHTGQASTSIGNTIVNLLTHMKFFRKMGNSMKLMVVLGDDNAMMTTAPTTKREVSENSARHFNMISKPTIRRTHAGYLRMFIYTNQNGTLELCPDFIRLRRRFEVLNGSGITTKENLDMRVMSYCSMLGGIDPVADLVKEKEYPLELTLWYNLHLAININAINYDTTPEDVESNINLLIKMMRDNELILDKKLMFTESGH
jgi:hypothetical protein